MTDLDLAKSLLGSEDVRFVLVKEGRVLHTSKAAGVKPLAQLLKQAGSSLAEASLADQVVGRAVALLAAYAHLAAVYGQRVSQSAIDEMKQQRIPLQYGESVPYILNRTSDGLCPFERSIAGITDPSQAIDILLNYRPQLSSDR
jgi:hypothetical protein